MNPLCQPPQLVHARICISHQNGMRHSDGSCCSTSSSDISSCNSVFSEFSSSSSVPMTRVLTSVIESSFGGISCTFCRVFTFCGIFWLFIYYCSSGCGSCKVSKSSFSFYKSYNIKMWNVRTYLICIFPASNAEQLGSDRF